MATAKWMQFHDWSGVLVTGTAEVPKPTTSLHMDRAFWLTSQLESGKFGGVQSYDGAAMSGGPLHNVAVLPRTMTQGDFFKLLRHLEISAPNSNALQVLFRMYAGKGWVVARDGMLRDSKTGSLISAAVIRDVFSPPGGRVPQSGPQFEQAKQWALAHSAVFADPLTFAGQRDFAIGALIATRKADEAGFYKTMNLDTLSVWTSPVPDNAHVSDAEYNNHLTLAEDLAMCMYHSHSVNGPSPAVQVLKEVLEKTSRGLMFAKLLIWGLGKHDYGRWKDTTDGKNRYDRTHDVASASGLWPKEFFTGPSAIMPRDLGAAPTGA